MRISDTSSPDTAGNVQPASTSVGKEAEHGPAPGVLQDQVSIGPVATAASKSLETPEPKIRQLRQQYLDGTYTVDAKELSAKIVDAHLEE